MRIVVDLQGAQTGSRFRGIGRAALCLTHAMAKHRGDDEIIVALNASFEDTIESLRAEFSGVLPPECIQVWRAPGPTASTNAINDERRKVAELMREAFLLSLNPDVIFITSHFEGLDDDAISSVHELAGAPTAMILYDLIPLINPDEHFRNSTVHQNWYRKKVTGLRRADLLLAISDSARQEAIDALDFEKDRVVELVLACDPQFRVLDLPDPVANSMRNKLEITKPFIMYTGGADERKNLDRLIIAFGKLPENIRNSHQLVMVGKMPEGHVERYRATAKRAKIPNEDLVFTGYVEDSELVVLYNMCKLFVFPSTHEGFGIPPLEAMACGAPVIGSNATSLPEIIGLPEATFDPHSIEAMTALLQRGLEDEEFQRKLRVHGAQQVKKFSWDKSAVVALDALRRFKRPGKAEVESHLSVEQIKPFKASPSRILLIKLDHLGDFLLAVPAIRGVAARYPGAKIDIVIGSWNAALAASLNIFENIYKFDILKRRSDESKTFDAMSEVSALLKDLPYYDVAIDLRRQPEERWVLASVGADVRVGYQTFSESIDSKIDILLPFYPDERGVRTFLNKRSISLQMLDLVTALPEREDGYVDAGSPNLSPTSSVQIAIFPRSGLEAREWGIPRFVSLANHLTEHAQVTMVNIYLADDKDVPSFKLKSGSEKIKIHTGLPLNELRASLQSNAICVANNSGGAHLAAVLGLTVLTIFSGHELSSEWGAPFGDSYVIHSFVPCAPCHLAWRSDCPFDSYCLNSISVDDVYGKVLEAVEYKLSSSMDPRAGTIGVTRAQPVITQRLIDAIAPITKHWSTPMLSDLAKVIAKNHPAADPVIDPQKMGFA